MNNFVIVNIEHGLTGDVNGTRFSGALRVRDGLIVEIGSLSPQENEHVVDARGTVVTPGLVNTHHHLFQSVLKAVPDGMNQALDIWLQKCPYAYWPFIDADILAVSARIGLAELVLSGATTVCDHHYLYTAQYDYDPTEVLFNEAARFGVRFLLARGGNTKGREYFDDPSLPPAFKEPATEFLEQVRVAAARWHDPNPLAMTRLALAPTTPLFNLEPEELPLFAEAARDLGIRRHSHLSENMTYVDFAERTFGKRPVHWLAEQDWIGPDVWFAHLVELDQSEIRELVDAGTAMAHCTQANARLGSGIAPADAFHHRGGIVSIGVDGAGANEAADMGAAMYAAFTTHRASKGVGASRAETILHWATEGGARALGFDSIGRIAPGMAADIVLFDLTHPRNLGLHDPALAPVITGSAVAQQSFVQGRPIVQDGRVSWLDLDYLCCEAKRITATLKEKRQASLN